MASGVEAPSFSLRADRVGEIALPASWPFALTREWAWGESTGEGVRICVIDSGVESGHPDVGEVGSSVTVTVDEEGYATVVDDTEGDVFGHGTACAGIIRSLAPGCEIDSVRVLGPRTAAAARCCSPGSSGPSLGATR